jgi:hypothetical protein
MTFVCSPRSQTSGLKPDRSSCRREMTTWNTTSSTMEKLAAYSSDPSLSSRSAHGRSSSRFKPKGSSNSNWVVPPPKRGQSAMLPSNGLTIKDPLPNPGSRCSVSPPSARSQSIPVTGTDTDRIVGGRRHTRGEVTTNGTPH